MDTRQTTEICALELEDDGYFEKAEGLAKCLQNTIKRSKLKTC